MTQPTPNFILHIGIALKGILQKLGFRQQHSTGAAMRKLLELVGWRIYRMGRRLERLVAHWRAGTLPKPRPSRAGQIRTRQPADPDLPRMPRRHNWMQDLAPEARLPHAGNIVYLASDPEFLAFIAAAPQAGRILRPLCHMLGITDLDPYIRLPPQPRKPRAERPKAIRVRPLRERPWQPNRGGIRPSNAPSPNSLMRKNPA
jgi:hypothetical protein